MSETLDSFPQGEFPNHFFLAGIDPDWNLPSLILEHLNARCSGYWSRHCVIVGILHAIINLLLDALGYRFERGSC